MTFELVVPELGVVKKKNTKDLVINALLVDWPLSSRQIFFLLKKKFRYSSSYQAVFKAISELVDKNVLTKKDKLYQINIGWVKKLQSFTDVVETNYYVSHKFQDVSTIKDSKSTDDILVLNFDSVFDCEKYLYYFVKNILVKKKDDVVCHYVNNEWRPFYYLRAEYNYYKKLGKLGHKFYTLCSGKSYMEKLCSEFYKKIGVNFSFTDEVFTNDLLVFDEYFIQIFFPQEVKENMKKLILKKDIIGLLEEVLNKKYSIKIIVTKDESLAQQIKKETIKKVK